MIQSRALLVLSCGVLTWHCAEREAQETATEDVPAQAVSITAPEDGAVVGADVLVTMAARGVAIVPAGVDEPDSGHLHLFIDHDVTPAGEPIPTEDGVVHLGAAQTEFLFEGLAPGEHTIIAVLGDYQHVYLGAVATDTVRVTVQ